MTLQKTDEIKGSARKKDMALVSSMLIIYAICCIVVMAGVFTWVKRDQEIVSANATATKAAMVTQWANVTATADGYLAEQDQYEYVERFDKVTGLWFTGAYGEEYADASMSVKDGVYIWDIRDSKKSSLSSDFYEGNTIKDFDMYVDIKFVKTSEEYTCGGLFFRRQYLNWSLGSYIFTICDDAHYRVHYYGKSGWQTITYSEHESLIHPSDWNRIGVTGRGNDFTFTINTVMVFEMTDDRLKQGGLGLFADLNENGSAEIWFDNFGYQSR